MSEVGDRLDEELKKLGKQNEVATHLGVSVNTLRNWVLKGNAPADALAQLAEMGLDALYVLKGAQAANDESRAVYRVKRGAYEARPDRDWLEILATLLDHMRAEGRAIPDPNKLVKTVDLIQAWLKTGGKIDDEVLRGQIDLLT